MSWFPFEELITCILFYVSNILLGLYDFYYNPLVKLMLLLSLKGSRVGIVPSWLCLVTKINS
jgi:hypothetical protein